MGIIRYIKVGFPEETGGVLSTEPSVMKTTQTTSRSLAVKESLISIREALDALGGKWKIPILVSLAGGSKRFTELKSDIPGITSKVLSRELKELERNNLVFRGTNEETDIVQYVVTNKCKSLEKVIEGLKEWGDYHRSNIFQRPIHTSPIIHFAEDDRQTNQK